MWDHNLSTKNPLTVETRAGLLRLYKSGTDVTVNMGTPDFRADKIPILNRPDSDEYELDLPNGERVRFAAVSVGNPHAVIQVSDVSSAKLDHIGSFFNSSKDIFPVGINVEVVERLSEGHIKIRIYERGVGETAACGSGACASVIALRRQRLVQDEVRVGLPGGSLGVTWPGQGDVYLTGPAEHVFEGQISLNSLLSCSVV